MLRCPSPTDAYPDPVLRLGDSRAILLDWDGCVALNNRPFDDAIPFLQRALDRLVILSNNSTHLPRDIAAILAAHGVDLPGERILLAGTETIRACRDSAQPTLLLASLRIRDYARAMGLQLVREQAERVILMRDTRFTYAKLERVVDALSQGAELVVANADRSHPGPAGRCVPETGALLAAIRHCVPAVQPRVLGKPHPMLFEQACALLGVAAQDAVMIGDNAETDGKGAQALGIQPLLVGGETGLSLGDLTRWLDG